MGHILIYFFHMTLDASVQISTIFRPLFFFELPFVCVHFLKFCNNEIGTENITNEDKDKIVKDEPVQEAGVASVQEGEASVQENIESVQEGVAKVPEGEVSVQENTESVQEPVLKLNEFAVIFGCRQNY